MQYETKILITVRESTTDRVESVPENPSAQIAPIRKRQQSHQNLSGREQTRQIEIKTVSSLQK